MNDGAYLSEVVAAESNWQARLRHVRQATEAPVDPRVMAAVTQAVVCVVIAVWRNRARWRAHARQMAADQACAERRRAIEDRLWLASLPEGSRAGVLERRRQEAAERERRAREILAQEETVRGDGAEVRT